jgi:hypothetical protein
MAEITDKEVKELADMLELTDEKHKPQHVVKIIKDKKQHSVRIPIKYTEAVGIDVDKDRFVFCLIPDPHNQGKLLLEGKLVKSWVNSKSP